VAVNPSGTIWAVRIPASCSGSVANGRLIDTSTVSGPVARIPAACTGPSTLLAEYLFVMIRRRVYTTSEAVSGVPSWNRTPGRT
jgi:hypothetical protein